MAATVRTVDEILYKGRVYPVQRVSIDASGNETGIDNLLVSAQAGKKILVLGVVLTVDTTTELQWKSGSRVIIEKMKFNAGNVQLLHPPLVGYWLETNVGEDLILRVFRSGAIGTAYVRGVLHYALVE